jgi:hypothetical protein
MIWQRISDDLAASGRTRLVVEPGRDRLTRKTVIHGIGAEHTGTITRRRYLLWQDGDLPRVLGIARPHVN